MGIREADEYSAPSDQYVDDLLYALGTLHMVTRSFDQFQDLLEAVKPPVRPEITEE